MEQTANERKKIKRADNLLMLINYSNYNIED